MKKPSLFKRLYFKRKIKKDLNPFICRCDSEFKQFKIIDFVKPIKLDELVSKLKEYFEYYRSEIQSFDSLDEKTESHNKEINEITSYNFQNDVRTFYKNPRSYKIESFNSDYEIGTRILKYNKIDEEPFTTAEQIVKLVNNYFLILNEYQLLQEYKQTIILKDKYYDVDLANELNDRLKPFKDALEGKEQFYNFPLLSKENFKKFIKEHNDNFVNEHINDLLFIDINGKSLDNEQRIAILKDEKASLTIAGAGSGKTLTICGKVKHLLNDGVKPEDILLLSYSKKSADDLEKKIKAIDKKLTVGTFHKIGLDILSEAKNEKFAVEDQFNAIIESYFSEAINNNPEAMNRLLIYYGLFLYINTQNNKYTNNGEMFEELKSKDFTTLKSSLIKSTLDGPNKYTFKKELVKSFEELAIANFYFINGIHYMYEKPYEVKLSTKEKRQYTPDFYLPEYLLYHEHYGIDKNGQATQYSGVESLNYVSSIDWKRSVHENYKTKCIETYSYEFSDGTIFDKLKKELLANGVEFKPLTNVQIRNTLDSIYQGRNFKSFINLLRTFIGLYKAKYQTIEMFDELKKSKFTSSFEEERATMFLDICKDIYKYYIDYLAKEDKIDFDDMILKSQDVLPSLDAFKYKYIIVDEFQDISYSRMKFLKSLIEHGNSKLFAVGDDWQAIYRFSGCDLGIFLNFKSYFGECVINYITSTHRNSQELQNIAGPFIKKNPQQISKTICSEKHLNKPIKIVMFENNKNEAFHKVLSMINELDEKANVLVLGRNNKDVEDIINDNLRIKGCVGTKDIKLISQIYPNIKLSYSTVHGSKGLEEDYVIIINADDSRLGFPNKMEDDPMLNLLLSEKDKIQYAEERRLWYVALTRTRSYTYILCNAESPSNFVDEIKGDCDIINFNFAAENQNTLMCPRCKSGHLIKRATQYGKEYYRCSNHPYCDYSISDLKAMEENKKCPLCGDYLILKKGKYDQYYACHNKSCHYHQSLINKSTTSKKKSSSKSSLKKAAYQIDKLARLLRKL